MNPQNGSQSGGEPNSPAQQDTQSAAANVLRSQIDELYGGQPVAVQPPSQQNSPQQPSSTTTSNPYDRTHQAHPQPHAEQWKAYHSAWQNYYQQYYAAYYAHQEAQKTENATSQEARHYFASASTEPSIPPRQETRMAEDITKDQALLELREKLLGKVKHQATKIRRSRHFVPITAALAVVLVFVFLQYNRVIFAQVNAYVSPGSIDVQNIVIDPTGSTAVGQDPRLIIPKINVDVPVLYDVGADYDSQMAAMQKGVAHFAIPGASSHPGEIGNTVLSGHSSNDLFDPGDYKFIFAQLDKLQAGDTIYANYQGKRYTYVVTKKEVVKPTEVSKLVYTTDKPVMTLITCTPLGTSLNRLLVTAEQVSPDPAKAASAPKDDSATNEATMPGSSPTLLERLFGAH